VAQWPGLIEEGTGYLSSASFQNRGDDRYIDFLALAGVSEPEEETAGPSTALRSGREDKGGVVGELKSVIQIEQ
jgi:hypothetical protein